MCEEQPHSQCGYKRGLEDEEVAGRGQIIWGFKVRALSFALSVREVMVSKLYL